MPSRTAMYAARPTVNAGSRMWSAMTHANCSRERSSASIGGMPFIRQPQLGGYRRKARRLRRPVREDEMANDGRAFRIGISGSYGGMNLGDEAILEGILGALRASLPAEVTVFSRNPPDTLARHRVEHAINPRSLTRKEITPAIRALDLLILGGGGILFDGEVDDYLREVWIAHEV